MKRTSHLPVLGVRATVDDLDDDLVTTSLGDGSVDDLDLGAGGDESFLHVCDMIDFRWCDVEDGRMDCRR